MLFNDRTRYPAAETITPLSRCTQRQNIACKTIVYAPMDMVFPEGFSVEEIMRAVAAEAGLDFDSDFLGLPYSDIYPCEYNFDAANVTEFFEGLRGSLHLFATCVCVCVCA